MPRHRYWFDTIGMTESGLDTGTIYSQAVLEDAVRGALVFGGRQGILYRMDLASGRVVQLKGLHAFAESHSIAELALSPDGEALLVVRRPRSRGRTNVKEMTAWQVWAYRKLVEEESPPIQPAGLK